MGTQLDKMSLTLGQLLERTTETQRDTKEIKNHLVTLNGSVGKLKRDHIQLKDFQ